MTEHSWGNRAIEIPGLEPEPEPAKPAGRIVFPGLLDGKKRTGRWRNKSVVTQPDDDDRSGPASGEIDEVLPGSAFTRSEKQMLEYFKAERRAEDDADRYNAGRRLARRGTKYDFDTSELTATEQKKLEEWIGTAEATALAEQVREINPFRARWPDAPSLKLPSLLSPGTTPMSDAAYDQSVYQKELREYNGARSALNVTISAENGGRFDFRVDLRAIDEGEVRGFQSVCASKEGKTLRENGWPSYTTANKQFPELYDAGFKGMSYESLTRRWVACMIECYKRRGMAPPDMLLNSLNGGRDTLAKLGRS